jgi:DNA polymerase elongation subunit (family B)
MNLVGFAKKKNLVCRNRLPVIGEEKEKIMGAYVREPKPGIYRWVVDFDFSSLYPSIIRSINIGPDTYIAKISETKSIWAKYSITQINRRSP